MKQLLSFSLMLFFFIACGSDKTSNSDEDKDLGTQIERPITLADPFILLDGNKYYAYGTMSEDGIVCFESEDLKNWTQIVQNNGLALHKDNSYGDKWFWAPEVYKVSDGRYAMAYSAEEHICIAFASSPRGPFLQQEKKPMFEEKGIDNHIFQDEDGQKYIYFCRFTNGNEIWVAKLNDDYVIDISTLASCIHAEDPWETKMDKVTEGPFVAKHNGKYIMTYSANHYKSQDYAVGYAVSDSPMGPWVKSENNPFLHRLDILVGTGHHSLFVDKSGNPRIVFHSHNSDRGIDPRIMHISSYEIEGDENPIMKVNQKYFTPTTLSDD
ncbi:MAG: glycoside hydrolase family 43 protein [Bacteroides xylanisolvens]